MIILASEKMVNVLIYAMEFIAHKDSNVKMDTVITSTQFADQTMNVELMKFVYKFLIGAFVSNSILIT